MSISAGLLAYMYIRTGADCHVHLSIPCNCSATQGGLAIYAWDSLAFQHRTEGERPAILCCVMQPLAQHVCIISALHSMAPAQTCSVTWAAAALSEGKPPHEFRGRLFPPAV